MPYERLEQALAAELAEQERGGTRKGAEAVIVGVVPPADGRGPRYLLQDEGDRPFLRMNSNGYLGLALDSEIVGAEEAASRAYGVGPGAVRFISGTWAPHVALENRLAAFHDRAAGMIFSSAYATVLGVLVPLITERTAVISDALNHNCIINALRLARPAEKHVYAHLDMAELERAMEAAAKTCQRAIVVTDGIFSMRGDHAPLDEIMALAEKHDGDFAENLLVMADDSHGVGAFGRTGRGTEEFTASPPVDLLVATLGKAFGVNGGYLVAGRTIVDFLRERSPLYVYSNPITPGEAAAAEAAVSLVAGARGQAMLAHLRAMTRCFESGLVALGYETIPGEHPVVPLMVRDTPRTSALVAHLRAAGVLATGLNFPVVPRGDEEIRFQISADHTEADIDEALAALQSFPGRGDA